MTPRRRLAAFRLDDELHEGLRTVYVRDGIQPAEQVRRAIRTWLEKKGVLKKKTDRTRAVPRTRS